MEPRTFSDIYLPVYLLGLGASLWGLGSMALSGFKFVGRIEMGGRLLPVRAMSWSCIPAYASPWVVLLLLLCRTACR